MGGEKCFIVQRGSQMLDVEGTMKSRTKFVGIDEQADFSGLAGQKPSDERVNSAH